MRINSLTRLGLTVAMTGALAAMSFTSHAQHGADVSAPHKEAAQQGKQEKKEAKEQQKQLHRLSQEEQQERIREQDLGPIYRLEMDLVPMLMDAGVDILWPLERAADQDPVRLRKKFGRSLRLWGGVDKRVLTQGPAAIDAHLREFIPLIEEGGFIPTVDHTVPPDVSWENFQYYMEQKTRLLQGTL